MSSTARNGMPTADCATSRLWTNWHSPDLIEVLPAAVYVCNGDAVVVAYNRRAAELWGREPTLGDTVLQAGIHGTTSPFAAAP